MKRLIRQWYEGKDIRLNPDEPGTIGGMGVLHETYKEFHWSAKAARFLVAFYSRNWQWLWATAISVITIYVSVLVLKP